VLTLMGRFSRVLLIAVVALGALAPTTAFAGCMTDPTSCMSPPPSGTARPTKTPAPTAKPTTKPVATTAPTQHYVPPPVSNNTSSSVDNSTPAPTPFPVDASPAATTVIETQPLVGDTTQNLNAENSASASSWIFGFIVGLLVGLLVGRASWGIKRRRRQQIFG